MKNIAVIGAGAAGMMAAVAAAESGAKVTIYEKNEKAGKKIYITGKGRCNVTNNADTDMFFGNVCRNPKFLYSAVYAFDHDSVCDFFEKNGCHLKVERGDRVFPVSDHSSDIIGTLVRYLQRLHVKIEYKSEVTAIEYKDDTVVSITVNKKEKIPVDAVIVCTGGISYESTGSTGDGYRFARKAGHSLSQPYPSLVPLEVKEPWVKELQGLSLKNVSVKMVVCEDDKDDEKGPANKAEIKTLGVVKKDDGAAAKKKKKSKAGKSVYEGFGEMLFTHFGISGPLILTASTCYEEGIKYQIHLNLKPALTRDQLDKRLIRDFEEGNKKVFKNILGGLFPAKLIPVMINLSGIAPDKKVSEISKEERMKLINLTQDLVMTVTGTRGFNEAIVTKGGVNVKEIDSSTMESKFRKGLYFAGEVLDLDAVTGGFNLQIAWSTGHLAGLCAAAEE
ncbi:hypothetical protein SAMN02745229_03719 [Butyrivibrio fibrisolvens DSM 3071]|uniref:NAD(P)/FAD-dependent oxidoreductase n=1 Tax=Butyrivibrio fibrisolvens DSM 3071 TaxID=1121131 RepID=A0A1M6EG32_BUTFI|nr:NAD(P)/FAD-dependent oxidoreductase [Butyrivibrio fibrisolvens]SHI84383.1 hypothetical protein SAMN02745229_03719 [Butyrivibrio fibrisolvens DSM 3071]